MTHIEDVTHRDYHLSLQDTIDVFRPSCRSVSEVETLAGNLVNYFRVVSHGGRYEAWRIGADECILRKYTYQP